MVSIPIVVSALQRALPNARITWNSEPDLAHLVVSMAEEEHYLGLDLTEPGLDEARLVDSILLAVVE